MTAVHLELTQRAGSTVVTATGTLTPATASRLRDELLKFATDAPDCVIADIRDLTVEHDRLFGVFSVIANRIDEWPGVSFGVVSDRPDHLAGLRARSIDQFVAVHPDVATAEGAKDRAPRERAVREFAPSTFASARARRFVEEICGRWAVPEFTGDAQIIATELVENTVQHTTSPARLRLELRSGLFRVAVGDDDPHQAVLHERLSWTEPGLGLELVAQTARSWGCSRSWLGGKVVWAVLVRRAGGTHDQ
ncbi:ATP-binding protein [Amycolatopsis sp. OK19-0408]|uniref:ATP-binding protein n=1 Tax=Amycolatopsis iheyensis TaxID=2945988 RepID=A0A9X2NEN8_9PSEU|nr:ATP-binding protein [Amycolatopsis iheyensis]MCR6483195.1 ATP-binding protein [Amycolatopsis iheyensis]